MHQHSSRFAHSWRRSSLLPSWFYKQCFLGFFHTSFHASKYASKEWLSAFNLQLSLSTFFLSFLFWTFDFSGRGIGYTQNFHESHVSFSTVSPAHRSARFYTRLISEGQCLGQTWTTTDGNRSADLYQERRDTPREKRHISDNQDTNKDAAERVGGMMLEFLFLLEVLCVPVSLWDFRNVKCNINKICYYYYCEGILC